MGFSFKNIKSNWGKMQQDPYFAAKFQYKMQRIFVYFIMGIIGLTFVTMVLNFKSSSSMGNIVRIFMIFIGVYLLYQIYARTILPTKRIIQHYESSPTAIDSPNAIDVASEVDEILGKYDKDGKRIT